MGVRSGGGGDAVGEEGVLVRGREGEVRAGRGGGGAAVRGVARIFVFAVA